MLTAVDLDDKFCIQAYKISDVFPDFHLAAEFVTTALAGTEEAPEFHFGICLLMPQASCKSFQLCRP